MELSQSNIKCIRTFKAWFYEYKQLNASLAIFFVLAPTIDRERAEMYYNGGYTPKMVIHETNLIPVGKDIL